MAPASDRPAEQITMYYDPLAGFNNMADLALSWLWWAFFLLPLDPERARSFFTVVKDRFLVEDADGSAFIQLVRGVDLERVYLTARGLALAHQLGDADTASKLRAHADANYEPTWDQGEFYYRFGLQEPHPRGQYNAQIMLAEVGPPGGWQRLFNEPNLRKFQEPTVCGVDYPRVGLSEAYYEPERRALVFRTYPATPSAAGSPTRLRVLNLRRPEGCSVLIEGAPYHPDRFRAHSGALEIEVTIDEKRYQVIEEPT